MKYAYIAIDDYSLYNMLKNVLNDTVYFECHI